MAKNTFRRVESKLLIDEALVPVLIERLLEYMDPDPYNIKVGNKPYEICNIYFDDECNSVIRHSISKPKYKEKLRLRSYGTPTLDSKVFLEIKKKHNKIGTKRRAVMPLSDMLEYLNSGKRPEGLKYIDYQVLNEIDYFLSHKPVEPKVYISYLRSAYFGKEDKNVRITVDREILTRRYDLDLTKGRYGEPLLPPGKILLEVKFHGAVPLWLVNILSDLGLSFGKYTKYGNEFRRYLREQISNEQ